MDFLTGPRKTPGVGPTLPLLDSARRRFLNPLVTLMCLVALAVPLDSAAAATRILMLGDSITAGYGLEAQDALPARLEAALKSKGHDVRVINAGVSGDTTAGGRARLDWAMADKPHIVIVELGGNDGLRGIDPAETRANLDAIVTRLKSDDVKVLLTGMLAPRNLGSRYTKAFDAVFPSVAKKHEVAFYPFILEGVAADSALNQGDGIHPNEKGVAIIVDRLLPSVVRLLDDLR